MMKETWKVGLKWQIFEGQCAEIKQKHETLVDKFLFIKVPRGTTGCWLVRCRNGASCMLHRWSVDFVVRHKASGHAKRLVFRNTYLWPIAMPTIQMCSVKNTSHCVNVFTHDCDWVIQGVAKLTVYLLLPR